MDTENRSGRYDNADTTIALLRKHNVPTEQWGTGVTKTLEQFLKEIDNEDSSLEETPDGELIRNLNSVGVKIHAQIGQDIYELVEDKQVFKDGRTRVRDSLTASIVEKMQPGENPQAVAVRAFKEELNMDMDPNLLFNESTNHFIRKSKTYPGLTNKYTATEYELWLPTTFYKPEGYIEEQEDKTTYFIWKKLN